MRNSRHCENFQPENYDNVTHYGNVLLYVATDYEPMCNNQLVIYTVTDSYEGFARTIDYT